LENDIVLKLFKQKNGYLSSADLQKYKVHTSIIRALVEQGRIERIKRGLYRLPPEELSQDQTFTHDYFDAVMAVPKGIFCLKTGLHFYGLTTYNPTQIDMAIPTTSRDTKLLTTAVKFYRFREPFYSTHIVSIKTSLCRIKIFNKERTVCDVIRMRHIVGEDIAMEGLNTYLRQQKKDINQLLSIAKFCKVKHLVEPAVKAMAGF
jgi:predicted transcriptional regulator of viral defense system